MSTQLMTLFEQLHGGGQTIILVTHESDIAEHARRVAVLRDGVIENDRLNESRRVNSDHVEAA